MQVILNKVSEACRKRFRTQKCDIRREEPLTKSVEAGSESISPDPTPSQLAIAAEEWERVLTRFPAGQRSVLMRLREGYTHEDIACTTGISPRTIKRIVHRLKEIAGL